MRTLLLASLISLPLHAAVSSHINTQTINLGETVQLTIEADQALKQAPDLSPLNGQFRIAGSKQMSISSYSGGERKVTTRWQILLRPLRHGNLTIPALQVGPEYTAPVSLTVLESAHTTPGILSQSLQLETSLDTNEIYVNSQAVLSVKLFHRNPLPDTAALSEPLSSDAIIKPLGEPKRYATLLRGETYQVLEQNYGIYPQYAGVIRFDPFTYNEGTADSVDQVLQKEPLELAVLSKATQKTPGYWLPASRVSLQDNLQERSTLTRGESLKRVITLEAHGILAADLPSLSPLRNELADLQLDNVTLEEQLTPTGVISTRTETLTVTPNERGEVTLAAVTIPWWNVIRDREEEQSLPARLIQVVAPAAGARTEAAPTAAPALAPASTESAVAEQQSDSSLLIWLLTALAIISSLGWLYTFNHMRNKRAKRETGATEHTAGQEVSPLELAELGCYSDLAAACTQNDCAASRILLIEWGTLFWPDSRIDTLEDIAYATGSQTFELLLLDLEHHLNQGEELYWRGDLLLEAVDTLRQRRATTGAPAIQMG